MIERYIRLIRFRSAFHLHYIENSYTHTYLCGPSLSPTSVNVCISYSPFLVFVDLGNQQQLLR